jgi:hypothetical protein
VLPILARFRLAAYVLGATAVVELLRAAARVRAAPDLPRSPDVAWGLVAAALAYLGRAVSVGAQVWQRFPDRRALAFVPVGAGLLFTGVALWLAWGAARASARDT